MNSSLLFFFHLQYKTLGTVPTRTRWFLYSPVGTGIPTTSDLRSGPGLKIDVTQVYHGCLKGGSEQCNWPLLLKSSQSGIRDFGSRRGEDNECFHLFPYLVRDENRSLFQIFITTTVCNDVKWLMGMSESSVYTDDNIGDSWPQLPQAPNVYRLRSYYGNTRWRTIARQSKMEDTIKSTKLEDWNFLSGNDITQTYKLRRHQIMIL